MTANRGLTVSVSILDTRGVCDSEPCHVYECIVDSNAPPFLPTTYKMTAKVCNKNMLKLQNRLKHAALFS